MHAQHVVDGKVLSETHAAEETSHHNRTVMASASASSLSISSAAIEPAGVPGTGNGKRRQLYLKWLTPYLMLMSRKLMID